MADLIPRYDNLKKCTKEELIEKIRKLLDGNDRLTGNYNSTTHELYECRQRLAQAEREILELRSETGALKVRHAKDHDAIKSSSEKTISRLEGKASGLIEALHVIADRLH